MILKLLIILLMVSTLAQSGINLLPNDTVCGRINEERTYVIVSGTPTELGEFPWAALIQYEDDGFVTFGCNGVLINKRYILTTAYCLVNLLRSNQTIKSVRLGEHDLQSKKDCASFPFSELCSPKSVDIKVEEIIPHEMYNRNKFYKGADDIGLLRLAKDISYSEFIQPICLPIFEKNKNTTNSAEEGYLTGWPTNEEFLTENIKRKILLRVVNQTFCNETYQNLFKRNIGNGQFCVEADEQQSCQSNSGSPFMIWERNSRYEFNWTVMGLDSYGGNCIRPNVPRVFTKVANYLDWILNKLKP